MKENKNRQNQAVDQDQDKTAFEKMEDEVKGTIFNVLYVLLKEEETSHWKHIVLILFDFVQIFHFSFAHSMYFPWKSDSLLHYVQVFMDFFQIPFWIGKLDYTTYLVFFYICIFVVCLVILDIMYVSYSFTRKKFTFVWPLQILRTVCGLFVTVLFLPFLETFTTMIHCHGHGGHYILTLFPAQECWHGMHIIHASFAIVVSTIFMIISLIVSLTYFESKGASHDISARVNSRADTFIIFLKIVLIYLYAFLVSTSYHWLIIAALLILSITNYFNFRTSWPYYSDHMNKFFCVLSGIFVYGNLCLFIAKIFESAKFSGALQIYFLGLPLFIGLIIFDKDERVQLLLKNINNFQKGEEVALQIRYLLHLIQTKDHNRKNAIILKGYIYHHEDSCPNADCHLKQYKQIISQQNKIKKSNKKQAQYTSNQDHYKLLLQHAKNMYRAGIQKFPTCTPLKIQYAFFLMETMEKKNEALAELAQALLFNPPFDEQFVIYRYQKMSEDYGDSVGGEGGHGGGGMDIVAKFAFESSLRQCQQHIQKSASLHLEFWNHLREERPDIAKLNECGQKINNSIVMVESYWSQLQKLNTNIPKALRLYAKFLIEILNDKEGGNDLLQRAKDTTNVKQNFYEGNNMHEDMYDINSVSQNGTPCVYVSGDHDKMGMITQCNAGACRIFGYSPNEIKNHNVEKLMPEMYAKNHGKIIEDALNKGAESIHSKERLVFGRHKSGYIFPVWICLKMITNSQGQTQFVALFKTDKKLVSSDIAYILLNKEKKIQGISSSCMQLMNLDIQKIKRLQLMGVDISKLAPNLFDNDHEGSFLNKQGGILDWYVPDFEKMKQNRRRIRKDQNISGTSITDNQPEDKKVIFGESKIQFSCNLNIVTMADLGEIGWFLKLENLEALKQNNNQKQNGKEKERLKQALFQFRFNPYNGKFIREIKDNFAVDNAARDLNYLSQLLGNGNDGKNQIEEEIKVDIEEIKVDVNDKDGGDGEPGAIMDLFEMKKKWAKGVNIYRLVNGKFQTKDYDEEIKKSAAIEEERKRKIEEEEKATQNEDTFKNNIKSRKALLMAISDKTTPRAIRNLSFAMNFVMVALLAISITEFSLVSSQFKDINENFNLIQQSYGRLSEIQRVAYDVRTLIMINEKRLTSYKNYTSETNFTTFLQNDIEYSLNNLYDLQNQIQLSSLTMSHEQQNLIDQKSVRLYFRDKAETLKTIKYSLTESVMQIASAIFSARHLNINSFTEDQEDLFFITYNVFNDFFEKMRDSSELYVEDLKDRAKQKSNLILILFLSSIGTLIITLSIFFPVISNVNIARMRVLSLFVDIPNHNVIALANKCEKFLGSFNEEHNEDEVQSEDNDNVKNENDQETNSNNNQQAKRGFHKQPKNLTGSNKKTFIQFGTAAGIVLGYFILIYILSNNYIKNIQVITTEMNLLAQAESYYSFAQNAQREMIYSSEKPILGEESYKIALDTIQQVYNLNIEFMEGHYHNQKVLKASFETLFTNIYEDDLCQYGSIIRLDLIPYECNKFLEQSAGHGLQTILVKYFETLKETMMLYLELSAQGKSLSSLINSIQMEELYIIQFRFIQDSFRALVDNLKSSTNTDFQTTIDTRMAAFIVFVIALGMAYLTLWMPFVSKLNKDIWRTKNMLTIIPIEVILKIPRIQEFLHSQNFFSNKKAQ